jgi:hypothetical protein
MLLQLLMLLCSIHPRRRVWIVFVIGRKLQPIGNVGRTVGVLGLLRVLRLPCPVETKSRYAAVVPALAPAYALCFRITRYALRAPFLVETDPEGGGGVQARRIFQSEQYPQRL